MNNIAAKFIIGKSKLLLLSLLFIYIGAITIVLCLHFIVMCKIVLLLLCLSSMVYVWRKYVLLTTANAIVEISCAADGAWFVRNNKNELTKVCLCGDSIVSNLLILINLKLENAKKKHASTIIFRDAMAADNFRRLKVRLTTLRKTA